MKVLKTGLSMSVLALCVGCAGIPNSEVLGGLGAVIGSSVTKSNPLLGAAIGGAAGYYGGSVIDQRQSAVGRTDCVASYSGSVDPSGRPSAQASPYNCTFRNSSSGNHNLPPPATPQ